MESNGILIIYYVLMFMLILALFLLFMTKYKARRDKHRYMLYRIRDKLVKYGIEGKIEPESKEFNILYKMINQIIESAEEYDLVKLLKIILQMEKIIKKQKYPKFIDNKYIEEILEDLAIAIYTFVYENSLLIRTSLKIRKLHLTKLFTLLKKLLETPQYEIYRKAEDIKHQLDKLNYT